MYMNVYRARAPQHEAQHAVWLVLCTSAADLQATASAADLSEFLKLDAMMI